MNGPDANGARREALLRELRSALSEIFARHGIRADAIPGLVRCMLASAIKILSPKASRKTSTLVRSETVRDVMDHARYVLELKGVGSPIAAEAAERLADFLVSRYGGLVLSFPVVSR